MQEDWWYVIWQKNCQDKPTFKCFFEEQVWIYKLCTSWTVLSPESTTSWIQYVCPNPSIFSWQCDWGITGPRREDGKKHGSSSLVYGYLIHQRISKYETECNTLPLGWMPVSSLLEEVTHHFWEFVWSSSVWPQDCTTKYVLPELLLAL